MDSAHALALGGGEETGPSPVDRSKPGVRHHVVSDVQGIPLATSTTAANEADVTEVEELVDAIPDVKGKLGHPKKLPEKLYADRPYDSQAHRE